MDIGGKIGRSSWFSFSYDVVLQLNRVTIYPMCCSKIHISALNKVKIIQTSEINVPLRVPRDLFLLSIPSLTGANPDTHTDVYVGSFECAEYISCPIDL